MNTELLRQFVELDRRRHLLEAELKETKDQLDALNDSILSDIEAGRAEGIDFKNIEINGRRLYLVNDRRPFCKTDPEALAAALKSSKETAIFVRENYNLNTLRSWTAELIDDHLRRLPPEERIRFQPSDALPEHVREHLGINEKYKVQTRKA